jgi:hypothetical protein
VILTGSEKIFLIAGVIGFVVLLLSLLFGELFEFGDGPEDLDGDVGFDTDAPTPSWFSIKVLAASLVGFGAFGFVATQAKLPLGFDWIVAGIGFFAVGCGTFFLVLRPLANQQSNSLIGRSSYIGRIGTVELQIPHNGIGQVVFSDQNGARVVQSAVSADGQALPRQASVVIIDVAKDGVVVSPNPLSLED